MPSRRILLALVLALCGLNAHAQTTTAIASVSSNYTVGTANRLVIVSASSSSVTITLGAGTLAGQVVDVVVKDGTNSVTVVKTSGDVLLDPAGAAFMGGGSCAAGESATFESDGNHTWIATSSRNNGCSNWVAGGFSALPSSINKGTSTGQTVYWDNTAGKWKPASNMINDPTTSNIGVGVPSPGRTLEVGGTSSTGVLSTVTSSTTTTKAIEAIGNNSTTSGSTNVALQVKSGDVTIGRRQSGAGSAGGSGVSYSSVSGDGGSTNGPSGIVDISVGGAFYSSSCDIESAGPFTINSQFATVNSIIQFQVLNLPDPYSSVTAGVITRSAGSFTIGLLRTYDCSNGAAPMTTVRLAYTIVNPDR